MRKTIYLIISLVVLMSCQQTELPSVSVEGCELEFASVHINKAPAIAAIDPELAVTLLGPDGYEQYFAPGTVPSKLLLAPGIYTVRAYTLNADTWHSANAGMGEPYYYAETTVEVKDDFVARVNMNVPMINYGVGLKMPEQFSEVFPTYTFNLIVRDRNLTMHDGEKAYFDASEGGFSYSLTATNVDGVSFSTTPIVYSDVQGGKLYQVCYECEYNIPTSDVRVCD